MNREEARLFDRLLAMRTAQGIEARQGQDAQRLDATHESPVAASDAPNKDSLMTNPSNRTDVTDAMIEAGALAFAKLDSPYVRDIVTTIFTAMLTAQNQSGEVEPYTPRWYVEKAVAEYAETDEGGTHGIWLTLNQWRELLAALRSAQPVDHISKRERDRLRGWLRKIGEFTEELPTKDRVQAALNGSPPSDNKGKNDG